MFMVKLATLVTLVMVTVDVASGEGCYTDPLFVKAYFCTQCKDKDVAMTLLNFGKCASESTKESKGDNEMKKLGDIVKANIDKPDECSKLISKELQAWKAASPDCATKVKECYDKNIKVDQLAKC